MLKKFMFILSLAFVLSMLTISCEEDNGNSNDDVCKDKSLENGTCTEVDDECKCVCNEGFEEDSDGVCKETPDKCADVTCEDGETCDAETGTCKAIDKCDDVNCEQGSTCDPETGNCLVDDLCKDVTCEDGEECVDGECKVIEVDPCEDVTCDDGMTCVEGECIKECKLTDSFMDPVDGYDAYLTLKLVGTIYADDDNNSQPTLLNEGTYKDYNGTDHNIADLQGMVLASDQDGTPTTLLLGFGSLNQSPEVGDIAYKVVQHAVPTQNLQFMKQEAKCTLDNAGSALPIVFEVFFDTPSDNEMNLRKQCIIGAGEVIDNNLTGELYAETAKNVDFSAGETFKGMLNVKMFDTEEGLITFLNTNQDGSVNQPGDTDYNKLCSCFAADGETPEACPGDEPTDEDALL